MRHPSVSRPWQIILEYFENNRCHNFAKNNMRIMNTDCLIFENNR